MKRKSNRYKVALVHDFLNDYGGAERVLGVLSDMFPDAPIYTSFVRRGSDAHKFFKDKKIVESRWSWLIRRWNLHSPFRFLIPFIWRGFDLSEYDVVITSCSSYISRGFRVGDDTKVVAYCHTPPRWLYGYATPLNWRKFWLVRVYGAVIGVFMRVFDFNTAQDVDVWLANSKNVRDRIWKFYRRKARVVYPPVFDDKLFDDSYIRKEKQDYYLIVSRLLGGKGLLEAAKACMDLGVKLKVVGRGVGLVDLSSKLEKYGVELLGFVSDEELADLYAGAKGFLVLAKDEDFGMTVVESMAYGTPVLAYRGGGFLETVVDGETGVFIDDTSTEAVEVGLRRMESIEWDRVKLREWASRFSRKKFESEIMKAIS